MPEGSRFTLPQAGHCLSSVWISLPSFMAQKESLAVHTPFSELTETPSSGGGGGESLPESG